MLTTFILLSCICLIQNIIFTLVAYIGVLSFGKIMLTLLIRVIIVALICLLISYLSRFLNRKFETKDMEVKDGEETSKYKNSKDIKDTKDGDNKVKDEDEDISYDNL